MDRNEGFYWWVEGDRVALRKESVDRNLSLPNFIRRCLSRSPQGERG